MKYAMVMGALLLAGAPACRAQDDAEATLCQSNPAYSSSVMRSVLEAQLQKDHDSALDAESPDQMAAEASAQGIKDCASDLRRNPAIYQALAGLSGTELPVGWDAYNTACSDRSGSKADCIKAEVGSVRALKHMVATDPAMTDWRECVDVGLSAHAAPARAAQCKTTVAWHTAKTGAQAGTMLKACLQRPS